MVFARIAAPAAVECELSLGCYFAHGQGRLLANWAQLTLRRFLIFGLLLLALSATEVSGAELSANDAEGKYAPGTSDVIALTVGLIGAAAAVVAGFITGPGARKPNEHCPPVNVSLHHVFVNPPPHDPHDPTHRPVPFPNAPFGTFNAQRRAWSGAMCAPRDSAATRPWQYLPETKVGLVQALELVDNVLPL